MALMLGPQFGSASTDQDLLQVAWTSAPRSILLSPAAANRANLSSKKVRSPVSYPVEAAPVGGLNEESVSL
jgi:hypothetical protein